MANNNRTEVSAFIEALAAVVDLEELKEVLNDQFAQSVIFRKDVSSTDTAPGASKTIDFLNIDYIAVTQTNITTAYTLSNVQQGEIKYLKIIKTATHSITFVAPSIDATPDPNYIKSLTEVLYQVTNKDGTNILVTPISQAVTTSTEGIEGIVEKATNAEGKAGTADKNITADVFQGLKATDADVITGTENEEWVSPAGLTAKYGTALKFSTVNIGDWNMDANTNPVAQPTNPAADKDKIMLVQVWIRDDADAFNTELTQAATLNGGSISITDTNINLSRVASGGFDNTQYDSTSFNRGFILIGELP